MINSLLGEKLKKIILHSYYPGHHKVICPLLQKVPLNSDVVSRKVQLNFTLALLKNSYVNTDSSHFYMNFRIRNFCSEAARVQNLQVNTKNNDNNKFSNS